RGTGCRAHGLVQKDILMIRAERAFRIAPGAAFLHSVVDEHRRDHHHAYREQPDLELAHGRRQAASSSRILSASSMSTATTRDTPDSGMVTPISWVAISMVILLWLMNRNCVCADILRTRSQKRVVLLSSSGASTSSSRQNGAGLSWNSENTSAIAVSAFSPPESRWMLVLRLPGGCAITCTPASRISSP